MSIIFKVARQRATSNDPAGPKPIIADSVEYMCNARMANALVCISNCDKITPGVLVTSADKRSAISNSGPTK